jgi:hypothetical protein
MIVGGSLKKEFDMTTLKDDLENYIENLVSKDEELKNITSKDIEKIILLLLKDTKSKKLSFNELLYKISFLDSIMMNIYLENRYGKDI